MITIIAIIILWFIYSDFGFKWLQMDIREVSQNIKISNEKRRRKNIMHFGRMRKDCE